MSAAPFRYLKRFLVVSLGMAVTGCTLDLSGRSGPPHADSEHESTGVGGDGTWAGPLPSPPLPIVPSGAADGSTRSPNGDGGVGMPSLDGGAGEDATTAEDASPNADTGATPDADPPQDATPGTEDTSMPDGATGAQSPWVFEGGGTAHGAGPLASGLQPHTADQCYPQASPRSQDDAEVRRRCFFQKGRARPIAMVEHVLDTAGDGEVLHVRVTLDPHLTNNTWGKHEVGWEEKFEVDDLEDSDRIRLSIKNRVRQTAFDGKLDYISWRKHDDLASAGIDDRDGDGKLHEGEEQYVLAVTTSLDRNLNACGIALKKDSPKTDENLSPSESEPEWDYRVVYELWLDARALRGWGLGFVRLKRVHASPNMLDDENMEPVGDLCPTSAP